MYGKRKWRCNSNLRGADAQMGFVIRAAQRKEAWHLYATTLISVCTAGKMRH